MGTLLSPSQECHPFYPSSLCCDLVVRPNIETNEIRHSNVLAWLLNPEESHNLGDKVFKKLISHVILENEDTIAKGIEISQIQLKSYCDLIVYREYKNIDILAVSKNHRFVLLIENKIKAKESRDQLKDYFELIQNEYSSYTILPIYLSLNGQSPSHDQRYCALDYPSLLNVIEQTVNLYKDYLPIPIRDFISFYLESLRGAINMDETTKKLCKEIYDQHKDALDLIYQVVATKETAFVEASKKFLENHPRVISTFTKPNVLWTTLIDFAKAKKMAHNWNAGHPVAVWFENYYGSLKIIVEVGPFDDPNKRIAFLESLSKANFKIGDYSKKQESRYTRIYTKVRKVNDWDDTEELAQLMKVLFDEIEDHIKRISQVIENFDW